MTIPISPYNIPIVKTTRPIPIPTIDPTPPLPIIDLVEPTPEISINASAQRRVADEIKLANKKLTELEQMYNITTDNQIRNDLYMKIEEIQTEINSNKDKINKLKRNAIYTQNCREKKHKLLTANQEVIQYDKPGHPPLLFEYPNLHDQIHDSVKFGLADAKR